MKARLFTALPEAKHSLTVKHYVGAPPGPRRETDTRRELGPALFLVIEEEPGGVFLYRFDAKGGCVSDTWHMTIDDAKGQAEYEFPGVALNWEEMPQSAGDLGLYVSARARRV